MKRHLPALALLGMCASVSTNAWAVRSPTEQGDLVVTEIMTEPQKVAVYFGQWLEVTNASGELLDLNGLVVQDATGAESFTVVGGSELLLPHGEAIVFGVSSVTDEGATGYNGNIPVDVEYNFGDFEMKRSSDTIRLTYDGDVIDEPVVVASPRRTKPNSWPDQSTSSSPRRERCIIAMAHA